MIRRVLCVTAVAVLACVPVQRTRHIAEDDPGWDCRTMGNHICGPDPMEHLPMASRNGR